MVCCYFKIVPFKLSAMSSRIMSAAASALTLLCMRVHEKEKRDKEKNKESKKEDTP